MTFNGLLDVIKSFVINYFNRPIAGKIIILFITGGIGMLSSPWWVYLIEFVLNRSLGIEINNSEVWGITLIGIGLLMYLIKFEVNQPKLSFGIELLTEVSDHEWVSTTNEQTGETFKKPNSGTPSHENFRLRIKINNDNKERLYDLTPLVSLDVKADTASHFSGINFSEEEYRKSPINKLTIHPKSSILFDVTGFLFMVPPLKTLIDLLGSPFLCNKDFLIRIRCEYYSDNWFYKIFKVKLYSDIYELRFSMEDKIQNPFIPIVRFVYHGERTISFNKSKHQKA